MVKISNFLLRISASVAAIRSASAGLSSKPVVTDETAFSPARPQTPIFLPFEGLSGHCLAGIEATRGRPAQNKH